MKIRVIERAWRSALGHLWARTDVEAAAIMMGEVLPEAGVLAVRQIVPVPDAAFDRRGPDIISINAVAMNRLIRPARDRGWSVVTVHTHPGASEPWFSWADDSGDLRLMPSLHHQMPGRPHGSVVVVPSGLARARLFGERREPSDAELVVVGSEIKSLTLRHGAGAGEELAGLFGRQILALGAAGHARLKASRVAVVGAGGTGSWTAAVLMHLGVGEIVLMDGDRVEATNVSRIIGARSSDRGPKVEVLERYAAALGAGTKVVAVREALSPDNVGSLASCDVVFSCVDKHTPRALLNRLAYRAYVPVIDMGTAFRVDASGGVTGDAGRVVVIGPGRPCLACWGDINPDALRWESLPPQEREQLTAEGYVAGAEIAQPSVMPFNGMVANAAVVEALRMLAGFCPADAPQRLSFSFSSGTCRRNSLAGARCAVCGADGTS